jgi:hypothetical protein
MSPRRLLLAVFASWLLVPVTCSVVAVPVTRLLIASTVRDLQAGQPSHLPPFVPVVDRSDSGEVQLVPLADLAARRAQTPTLTAWLPEPKGAAGDGDHRVVWRPVPSTGHARKMEVMRGDTHTHTFRYAVSKDGQVTPLRSTLFDMSHMFMALALGIVVALLVRFLAAWARARMARPPPLPPRPSPSS